MGRTFARYNDGGYALESYDVCLSYAHAQRAYVREVAEHLTSAGKSVFYDRDEPIEARAAGRDLPDYLNYVYGDASQLCVLFASADYAVGSWTQHERKSAIDRAVRESYEYLLPVRFDDTDIPGLPRGIAYIDARLTPADRLGAIICAKLDAAGP